MKKLILFLLCATSTTLLAAGASFTIDAGHPSGKVSPRFCGLMTEEINHAYDGGLYAELICNRAFLDDARTPVNWSVVNDQESGAAIALDPANAFNDALTTSLRLTVNKAALGHPAGVANSGYWGIPVHADTRYRASLLVRSDPGFSGPLTVSITGEDGKVVYASQTISGVGPKWKRFEVTLKTRGVVPTAKARFQVTLDQPGTVWFGLVSLFPPTFHDRPNGFRPDLMQMLVDLKPKFLRFPGGNYLEGDTVETRFDWKKTLGPIEQRHGHPCPWGYRSTDGMGLLEFLEWCEDMKAEPLLAVYAGYSLSGVHVNPGPELEPYVQEALEEIEYVTGDTGTPWGARRAKDGHPKPFKLTYVEIGNEDWFDKANTYDARYARFHDAIKARYPNLKLISTIGNDQPENMRVHSRKPDMTDEHYYRSTDEFLQSSPDYARKYERSGPEIFVGEWAAHEDAALRPWSPEAKQQPPTPSMKAALGDAVFMAAMERNSDVILMQCYAPMFVNVSPGARQWRPDLIGYDALSAFGSPSYYAMKMFSENLGNEILPVESKETSVQGAATRDRKTGEIFIKLVNPQDKPETLQMEIKGIGSLASKASVITLAAEPGDMNSIEHPRNVYPTTTALDRPQPVFNYTLLPHSIVVLKMKTRS
jgi:alpha-N-arabinofuranosidase